METKFTPITMDNLSWQGRFIRAWEHTSIEESINYRIYFKPSEDEGNGFEFAVIEWVSTLVGEDGWSNGTEVRFLFNGIAYFDGIRHLWLGTNQDEIFGYVNYPNLEHYIAILKELRKLEKQYCRDF